MAGDRRRWRALRPGMRSSYFLWDSDSDSRTSCVIYWLCISCSLERKTPTPTPHPWLRPIADQADQWVSECLQLCVLVTVPTRSAGTSILTAVSKPFHPPLGTSPIRLKFGILLTGYASINFKNLLYNDTYLHAVLVTSHAVLLWSLIN